MDPSNKTKTIVQCDFDGTITEEDESFLLLDAFAGKNWRQIFDEYKEGKISVGAFNARAFTMIKADKQTMLDFVQRNKKVRPGFQELVSYCRNKSIRLVIVSNGLDFYIEAILKDIGMDGIEVFAAKTWFYPGGLDVKYIGPNGNELQNSFKEAHTKAFLSQGYRVIYVGNGPSDMPPAKLAHRIFARDGLLELCRDENLNCIPFADLHDVVKNLEN